MSTISPARPRSSSTSAPRSSTSTRSQTRSASPRRTPRGPGIDPAKRSLLARGIDAGVILVALIVAWAGFIPTYGLTGTLTAVAWGAVVGGVLAILGARLSWGVSTIAAIAVLAYVVGTGAILAPTSTIATVIPSLTTVQDVALAAIHSWRDTLTLAPPLVGRPSVLALPLLIALVTSLLALSFALRLRRPWWALLPIGVAFLVPILFGTRELFHAMPRGVLLFLLALGWAAWRWREASAARLLAGDGAQGGVQEGSALPARTLTGVAMLVGVAVIGGLGGPLTQAPGDRFVLRDLVVPPLQLEDYPSPLQAYRGQVRDLAEETMFTVEGLPQGARLRLATMDGYDGVVYDVTEGTHGSFVSSATQVPLPAVPAAGDLIDVTVTVGAYDNVWVPTVGEPRAIVFEGENASEQARALYVDPSSSAALTTAGITTGDVIDLETVLPFIPSDDQLAGKGVMEVSQPPVEQVPNQVASTGAELLGPDADAIRQIRSIQVSLSSEGTFSNGLEGQAPSRSGHGAERLATFLGAPMWLGDDEQYAASMALMLRQLGMPARVVLGAYPAPDLAGEPVANLTGDDLHVWVEVAFNGYGWVPFDPTPPEDQVPQDQEQLPRSNPQPQVLQPPPPPEVPVQEPPAPSNDDAAQAEDDDAEEGGLGRILLIAGAVGVPLIVILAPFVAIAAAKTRRRKRRARATDPLDRVSGGWREVIDAATDLGTPVPVSATRHQTARLLEEKHGQVGLVPLAAQADAYIFGEGTPPEVGVAALWTQVGTAVKGMGRSVSGWQRFKAKYSLRSLKRRRLNRPKPTPKPGTTPKPTTAEARPAPTSRFRLPRRGAKR